MKILLVVLVLFIIAGCVLWVLNEKYDFIEELKIKREFKKKYQAIHDKYKELLK